MSYSEVALSKDEADFAAWNLQRSATFLMASAVLGAIRGTIANPKTHGDPQVVSAYQIARLIRNAFAHSPFNPIWQIDPDCRSCQFEIADVIKLDAKGLDGKPFDWRHYGGPLALFRLSQFVRHNLLGDKQLHNKAVSLPEQVCYQQGDLILVRVSGSDQGLN